MSRLSKSVIKQHNEALEMLQQQSLSYEERDFVIENWQESATHINSAKGAFFTPLELAQCFALVVGDDGPIIDLCAGIGSLAYAAHNYGRGSNEITCVEINPDYVEVGRKVLPEAKWHCVSVEDVSELGRFHMAISNPPFGKTAKIKGPRYSGEDDLSVVDVASQIAGFGAFILPSQSVPFQDSGIPFHKKCDHAKYNRFREKTGITLQSASIDCQPYREMWRGVSPKVEIATAEFAQPNPSHQ